MAGTTYFYVLQMAGTDDGNNLILQYTWRTSGEPLANLAASRNKVL